MWPILYERRQEASSSVLLSIRRIFLLKPCMYSIYKRVLIPFSDPFSALKLYIILQIPLLIQLRLVQKIDIGCLFNDIRVQTDLKHKTTFYALHFNENVQ